ATSTEGFIIFALPLCCGAGRQHCQHPSDGCDPSLRDPLEGQLLSPVLADPAFRLPLLPPQTPYALLEHGPPMHPACAHARVAWLRLLPCEPPWPRPLEPPEPCAWNR